MSNNTSIPRLITKTELLEAFAGISYVTIWKKMQKGEFPEPIELTDGRIAWYEDEILEWLQNRKRRKYGARKYENA